MNKADSNDDKSFEKKFVVPFHDLDPLKVVWHGNYFKYFDKTRADLFESLGVDLYQVYTDMQYIFPIIRTSIKYVYPLRFRDEFICKAKLLDAKYKITVQFEIRLAANDQICVKGKSEQAAVKIPEMESMLKIPDYIRNALGY